MSLDIVSTVDPRETRQQEVKEYAGAAVVFSRLKSEEMAFCSGDILDEPVASAGKSPSKSTTALDVLGENEVKSIANRIA